MLGGLVHNLGLTVTAQIPNGYCGEIAEKARADRYHFYVKVGKAIS